MISALSTAFNPSLMSHGLLANIARLFKVSLFALLACAAAAMAASIISDHALMLRAGVAADATVVAKRFDVREGRALREITLAMRIEDGTLVQSVRPVSFQRYHDVAVGETIPVTYIRTNPDDVRLGTYALDLSGLGIVVVALAIGIVGVAMYAPPLLPAAWTSRSDGRPRRRTEWIARLARVAAALACFGWAAVAFGAISERDRLLGGEDARTTDATIIELWADAGAGPLTHWIAYRFATADGGVIVGRGIVPRETFEAASIGQAIGVSYAASKPFINVIGTPLAGGLGQPVALAIALLCAAYAAWQIWRLRTFERKLRPQRPDAPAAVASLPPTPPTFAYPSLTEAAAAQGPIGYRGAGRAAHRARA